MEIRHFTKSRFKSVKLGYNQLWQKLTDYIHFVRYN